MKAGARGYSPGEPAGDNGFGYDPLFFFPELDKTFAQLSMAEKAKVSHRGKGPAGNHPRRWTKILDWIDIQMSRINPEPSGCLAPKGTNNG